MDYKIDDNIFEKFCTYQVRINLLQQNIVNLSENDGQKFHETAQNIIQLFSEVSESKNSALLQEFLPQIEKLCTFLEDKTKTLMENDKFPIDKIDA